MIVYTYSAWVKVFTHGISRGGCVLHLLWGILICIIDLSLAYTYYIY